MRISRRRALTLGVTSIVLTACGSPQQPERAGATDPTAGPQPSDAPTNQPAASSAANPATTQATAPVETPPDATSPPLDQPGANATQPSVPVEVPESLRVSAPLVGGGQLDFATFSGKPVALWFWAPG